MIGGEVSGPSSVLLDRQSFQTIAVGFMDWPGGRTLLAYVNLGSSLSNLSCDKTAKGASHNAFAASAMSQVLQNRTAHGRTSNLVSRQILLLAGMSENSLQASDRVMGSLFAVPVRGGGQAAPSDLSPVIFYEQEVL